MKRSTVPRRRSRISARLALLALLGSAACAPIARAPVPGAPGAVGAAPAVRVGLVVDTVQVEIGATTDFDVVDGATGRVLNRISANDRAIVRGSAGGELLIEIAGTQNPGGTLVTLRPTAGGLVTVGDRQYRGNALVRAAAPGRVTVINHVDMEDYLLGVVPYEIGRVGPELLEAAKAQAVAARTYAVRYLGRRENLGFDVFATVQDQVYGGYEGEHDPVSIAVRETAGEILTYAGEPIEAFYHSTCAGQTAAIEEVWPEAPRPYLTSVVDIDPATGEAWDVTSNRFRWTQSWTADELRQILNQTLADSLPSGVRDIGELRDFQILEHTHSGRIARMRITTDAGTFHVGRDRIRWIFLTQAGNILNSSKFDIRTERDGEGRIREVIAEGMGWGHGIGMCQVGAMGRARAGQDYRTILRSYYSGTEIVSLY